MGWFVGAQFGGRIISTDKKAFDLGGDVGIMRGKARREPGGRESGKRIWLIIVAIVF
jgi:hypothetical protein